MRIKLLVGLLACMAVPEAPQAAQIKYQFNLTTNGLSGPVGVYGTITTDGTLGAVLKRNIVRWDVTITNVNKSAVLNKHNSSVQLSGKHLTATSTGLFYNFMPDPDTTTPPPIDVFFIGDNNVSFLCFTSVIGRFGSCFGTGPYGIFVSGSAGEYNSILEPETNQQIAAVPPPYVQQHAPPCTLPCVVR